ncbi:AI-2E family transporter [Noviherbaspirillum sp. UKPF54]|uniref:AI-2E family transporter n=1 Tax=Noviherbaspirillum sp. UKPF54 TaxID=2601898 RepID=UPI0011B14A74|nr:AI-2E family transporter [Noviherbaspirillum sp. UKPF54]QDZ29524.1 AI-2E family transporter [Noviherbaspirillum sp. UKPF54]
MSDQNKSNLSIVASYLLAAAALVVVLRHGLLASLFSGLLVYSLVHLPTPLLGKNISDQRARMIAVALLAAIIVLLLSLAIWGAVSFFQSDTGSVQVLMQKLADIVEASRPQMPAWLKEHIPESAEAIREMISTWLRAHAAHAQTIGQEAGRTIAHLLMGMAIGAMAALYDTTSTPDRKPLAAALHARVVNLNDAFRRIVFAQIRIAGINAALTAVYLAILLPLAGIHLPLTKSMIAVTFFAGLLPVIGNLISNSVIVIVSLSHSLAIGVTSLLFLVVIHKLEYFLNAKIIGSHINARAWELLAAMLTMEAMFGLPGLVAAPVFYAYIKKELSDRELV